MEFQLQFPRLFFWPPVEDNRTFKDVDGLSGGPVFGYRVDKEHIDLRLVGIQSKQLEISRLAAVCPAEPFGLAVTAALGEEIARRHLNRE